MEEEQLARGTKAAAAPALGKLPAAASWVAVSPASEQLSPSCFGAVLMGLRGTPSVWEKPPDFRGPLVWAWGGSWVCLH